MARNSPFSSFHFLFLLSCSCPFFSLGQGDQMADDKTRHQEKRVKPMVGMFTQIWWKNLFLAYFWAWPKVWVDGPESTKEKSVGWLCLARLGSNSVFLVIEWLMCVTQTARGTPAGEGLSSSPHVLSLHSYSLYVYSRRTTWDRSLAERLGNLRRRSWIWRINFFCWTPCWDGHACNADGQQHKVEWNTCDCRIRKGSVIGIVSLQGQEENH